MPVFQTTSMYFETGRSLIAPGLLLAASLLGPLSLHAQSTKLQPTSVSFTSASVDQRSSSSLPDAPDAVMEREKTNNDVQAGSASYGKQTIGAAYSFPSARQRERHFLRDLVGPTAFIAPAFESGIDTLRPLKVGFPSDGTTGPGNHPAHGDVPEWGEGAQGYAKRYADRFGQGSTCEGCIARNECRKWNLHAFRRSYATSLSRAGIDARTIMALMGHSDIETTMRYLAAMNPETAQPLINKVKW